MSDGNKNNTTYIDARGAEPAVTQKLEQALAAAMRTDSFERRVIEIIKKARARGERF